MSDAVLFLGTSNLFSKERKQRKRVKFERFLKSRERENKQTERVVVRSECLFRENIISLCRYGFGGENLEACSFDEHCFTL